MLPFFLTFIFIGLAELGDKTQLLSLVLASRYRFAHVFLGVLFATASLQLLAVSAGSISRALVSPLAVKIIVGTLFLIFGLWMLRTVGDETVEEKKAPRFGPILTTFVAFFLAELGDKTQLATAALATRYSAALQVWLGATAGMLLVNTVAILVGNRLSTGFSQRVVKIGAGLLFIVFALITLASAILSFFGRP